MAVQDDGLKSGRKLAAWLISNTTSSLPFAGSWSNRPLTTARVLTVESITDWNASTGGKFASLFSRASRPICSCRAFVSSHDWRAAFTGNELYLYGLYSGEIFSQAALANGGSSAGSPANPANRAKDVTPIIGESRIIC